MEYLNGWTREKVEAHVRAEFKGKAESGGDDGTCLYKTDDGKKCAVGMFISDDIYIEEMEHKTAQSLFRKYPDLIGMMPFSTLNMYDWQNVHDNLISNEDQLATMLKFLDR